MKFLTRIFIYINSKIYKDVNLYEPITTMDTDSEEKMQMFVHKDLDLLKKRTTTSASAAHISKYVYYYFPPEEEETEGSPIPRHPRTPNSE